MTTDDRTETITDRAAIHDSDEPSERGDFPCCSGDAVAALDLDAMHETICDKFTGMDEVQQAADALVAEVFRLRAELGAMRDATIARRSDAIACAARAEAAEAEVVTLRAKVAEGRRIIGSLAETLEGECEDDPEICHGHDRYEGRCALLTDLERALAALATGEGK